MMTTRRDFLAAVPAVGAAFAVAGDFVFERGAARAQEAPAPLAGHFHPKGKAPSSHPSAVRRGARDAALRRHPRLRRAEARASSPTMTEMMIMADAGHVAWDMARIQFLDQQDEFDSIHPSLHRISRLNNNYGLYEVVPGIYQVRGFDLSDISFVRGKTGWIVFDPLVSRRDARAAWKLFQAHKGEGLPVSAVIYSHTHGDHWGGVRGIVDDADMRSGRSRSIAPGRLHGLHRLGERLRRQRDEPAAVLPVRPAAARRAARLRRPGHRPGGVGGRRRADRADPLRRASRSRSSRSTACAMVFQNTPNTEAPREMNIYIPGMKALWMGENIIAALHNIYTLRGARSATRCAGRSTSPRRSTASASRPR